MSSFRVAKPGPLARNAGGINKIRSNASRKVMLPELEQLDITSLSLDRTSHITTGPPIKKKLNEKQLSERNHERLM
jgi:hypothetical protein